MLLSDHGGTFVSVSIIFRCVLLHYGNPHHVNFPVKFGKFPTVIFSPDTLDIISGGKAARLSFFNRTFCRYRILF